MGSSADSNNSGNVLANMALHAIRPEAEKQEVNQNNQNNQSELDREIEKLLLSSLIPERWKNRADLSLIIELSSKMNVPKFTIAQNLVGYGKRVGWKSSFVISCINTSKRFKTKLKFKEVGKRDTDDWGYYAYIKDEEDDIINSPIITIAMAKKEGWYDKEGSKWPSMPDTMMQYRASAFFGRLYASDILMGMQSDVELMDFVGDKIESEAVIITIPKKDISKKTISKKQTPSAKKVNVVEVDKKVSEAIEFSQEYKDLVEMVEIFGFELTEPVKNSKNEYWLKATALDIFSDHSSLLGEAKFIEKIIDKGKDIKMFVRNITDLITIK